MQAGVGLLILAWCLYIDHCLGYHHNYSIFYQLPNSNLFTHRMLFFSREATSEIYGPRVYSSSYLLSDLLFATFIFRSIIPKTQNTLLNFSITYFISCFIEIYLSNLHNFYSVNLTISGTVTRKGLTTPLIRRVASIC